jgi:hypothetical protein
MANSPRGQPTPWPGGGASQRPKSGPSPASKASCCSGSSAPLNHCRRLCRALSRSAGVRNSPIISARAAQSQRPQSATSASWGTAGHSDDEPLALASQRRALAGRSAVRTLTDNARSNCSERSSESARPSQACQYRLNCCRNAASAPWAWATVCFNSESNRRGLNHSKAARVCTPSLRKWISSGGRLSANAGACCWRSIKSRIAASVDASTTTEPC